MRLSDAVVYCGATAEFCMNCEPKSYICRIVDSSDDELFDLFTTLRWGDAGTQTCPACKSTGKHYFKSTRKQWQCKDCSHTFSATSGTVFAFRKLSLRDCMLAVAIVSDGDSATRRVFDIYGVQYKTAHVLVHKIRDVAGGLSGFMEIARACAKTPPSPDWCGCWQRGKS